MARDRARGVLLGLAAGNLLGLPVEGDWYGDIAVWHPNGLTEIDPREAGRPGVAAPVPPAAGTLRAPR